MSCCHKARPAYIVPTLIAQIIKFRGMVARPDGSELLYAQRKGPVKDAIALGMDAAAELRGQMEDDFFMVPDTSS